MKPRDALPKKRNDGSKAQNEFQKCLKNLEQKYKSTWLRLYDSKSAGLGSGGNVIPEQPGDFIFSFMGTSALIEVKSSDCHRTLADCTIRNMFKESQIMGARIWLRSGNPALSVFYSLETGVFEIWPSQAVVNAYLAPVRQRKLDPKHQMYFGRGLEELGLALMNIISYTISHNQSEALCKPESSETST